MLQPGAAPEAEGSPEPPGGRLLRAHRRAYAKNAHTDPHHRTPAGAGLLAPKWPLLPHPQQRAVHVVARGQAQPEAERSQYQPHQCYAQ